jgi:cathepsin L
VSPTTGAATVGSFAAFTEHYGRVYGGGLTEYEARRNLFEERAAKVLRQNLQPYRRWTAAINAFSDRTANELTALRGWTRHGSPQEKSRHEHGAGAATRRHGSSAGEESLSLRQMGTSTSRAAPHKSVSWAFLNATKRHYDQGSCGSCWAIASAVLLEAHSEIHAAEGKGRTFSAQELVSCVPNPEHCGGTGGCEGATIELAMEWTMKHGLAEDSKVPYKAMDGECRVTKQSEGSSLLQISDRGGIRSVAAAPHEESPESHSSASSSPAMQFGMIGWERLPENSYDAILHALQDGPIGISVAASDWFEYSYGVFDKCQKDAIIDHAVVMIGYGQEEGGGDGYWLLKNSWGPEWGEHGLMRLLRKTGEEDEGAWCGIDRQPELGSGCDGGPKEVTVCGTCGILYDTVVPHWKGSAEKAKERALSSEEY